MVNTIPLIVATTPHISSGCSVPVPEWVAYLLYATLGLSIVMCVLVVVALIKDMFGK